jgi:predicted Zn-dependent protease with MMP-like domain
VGNRRGTGGIDAVHEATTLEEMIAERMAQEATRIAEERIKVMFRVTEFDPDEVFGFMTSEEAAEFLGLPYSSFREIAPNLPRHAITPARYGYLRRELLAWGRER